MKKSELNFRVKKMKTSFSNGIFVSQVKIFGVWLNLGICRLHLLNNSMCFCKTEKEAISRIKVYKNDNIKKSEFINQ